MVYKFKKWGQETQRTAHLVFDFKARSMACTSFESLIQSEGVMIDPLKPNKKIKVKKEQHQVYKSYFKALPEDKIEKNQNTEDTKV